MIYLFVYVLSAAIVFGWLLHTHLSAPTRFDRVPVHIPILLLGLWAARLDHLRAGYRADLLAERSARALDAANGRAAVAAAETGFAKAQAGAVTAYADRLASREPIILHSTNTVREYAQTDAGRAVCRAADRVRSIDLLDADLAAPAGTARSSGRAVQPDPAAPTG